MFSSTSLFIDSNETFKRIRLSDACFIKIGLTYSKTSKDSIAVGLLNISDINSDYIDLNKLGRSGIDKNINADLFLQMNDVILARLGTGNFKTGIIKEYVPNCIPSQNIIILRTMNPLLNPDYLNIFLQSPKGKKILKDAESGQVIKRLNLRDVANIEIPLPSLEAQQEIVDKFNKAKENYQTTINQAEQQWQKVQENIYQAL